jgi:hypothetical protein
MRSSMASMKIRNGKIAPSGFLHKQLDITPRGDMDVVEGGGPVYSGGWPEHQNRSSSWKR